MLFGRKTIVQKFQLNRARFRTPSKRSKFVWDFCSRNGFSQTFLPESVQICFEKVVNLVRLSCIFRTIVFSPNGDWYSRKIYSKKNKKHTNKPTIAESGRLWRKCAWIWIATKGSMPIDECRKAEKHFVRLLFNCFASTLFISHRLCVIIIVIVAV